jgi:tripartite-type tricarboxylate transporter receptor subunit TctC
VIPLGNLPNALVANPAKYHTIRELVAAGNARPGALSYGSGGVGAIAHLNAERFRLAAGFEAVHVPYKGAPEVLTDVIAGRVDFYFSPLSAALSLIRDGQVRALAVSSTRRSAALPDVPTTLEAGYANSDYSFWAGLCAPAGTPREIVERLHRETARALAVPDIRERLANLGAEPMPMTPAEFDAYLLAEIRNVAAIVRAAGIKPI